MLSGLITYPLSKKQFDITGNSVMLNTFIQ